jgi:chromosome segregation ATPase
MNLHQPIWWLEQFRDAGFRPDLTFDAGFVAPHAMLLRKCAQPWDSTVLRLFSETLRTKNKVTMCEETVRQLTSQRESLEATVAHLRSLEPQFASLQEQHRESLALLASRGAEVVDLTASMERSANLGEKDSAPGVRGKEIQELKIELGRAAERLDRVEHELRVNLGDTLDAERTALAEHGKEIQQLKTELGGAIARLNRAEQGLAASVSESLELRKSLLEIKEALVRNQEQAVCLTKLAGEIRVMEMEQRNLAAHVRESGERAEQRVNIFLQEIETSASERQRVDGILSDLMRRWDREWNNQKAVTSRLEGNAAQITSLEPRIAETHARVEELSGLYVSLRRQIVSVADQVQQIVSSRIWKFLVGGGGVLLKLAGKRN